MHNILLGLQLVLGGVLVVAILVQSKGTGFGRAWGSASSFTRRGLEKVVFRATFILGGFFILISILSLIF